MIQFVADQYTLNVPLITLVSIFVVPYVIPFTQSCFHGVHIVVRSKRVSKSFRLPFLHAFLLPVTFHFKNIAVKIILNGV